MIKFEGQRDLLHLSGERNASCTKDVVSNAIAYAILSTNSDDS